MAFVHPFPSSLLREKSEDLSNFKTDRFNNRVRSRINLSVDPELKAIGKALNLRFSYIFHFALVEAIEKEIAKLSLHSWKSERPKNFQEIKERFENFIGRKVKAWYE